MTLEPLAVSQVTQLYRGDNWLRGFDEDLRTHLKSEYDRQVPRILLNILLSYQLQSLYIFLLNNHANSHLILFLETSQEGATRNLLMTFT